jgi:DNA-directed RNA polymerase beta' subunit
LYIKSCIRDAFKTESGPIYKTYVFSENEETDDNIRHEMTKLSIQEIKKNITVNNYRIELRYKVNNKKYRAIIRTNDNVTFPFRKEMGINLKPTLVNALLILKDTDNHTHIAHGSGSGSGHDVTDRIVKYFGPNRDFNVNKGVVVYVQDMFPFDDHEDNSQRFSVLRLHMSDDKYYDFDYALNEQVVL